MNMSSQLRRLGCIIVLSTCAAAPILAKESGFYLGTNLGQSTYDSDIQGVGLFPIVTGSEVDDSDFAYSLAFGYRFMPYLGAEVSLNDFGGLVATETGFITTTPSLGGYADAKISTRGPALALIGALPVQNFEFFGKVGAMRAETKLRARITSTFGTLPTTGIARLTTKATSALYGAGVGYTFADEFYVKLEWMRVAKVAEEDDDIGIDIDVDVVSFGFQYRF